MKYFAAGFDFSVLKPLVERCPSPLQDAKHTLNVLPHTLYVRRKIVLQTSIQPRSHEWAYGGRPRNVPVIADNIHTFRRTDLFVMRIIIPLDTGKPTLAEHTNVVVNLNDMLIVISSELRTEDPEDATIEVCDALESKGRIQFLAFRAIVVPCRTVGPLHMNNVKRSGSTRETYFLVPSHYLLQLLRRARHENILVRYARDVSNKQQIEVAMI
jgi:hypothetical protein